MNGRAYDYNLGRFLSVDPFIQSPGNSQAMNPYSYILNNPLSGTDPSGYLRACDTFVICNGHIGGSGPDPTDPVQNPVLPLPTNNGANNKSTQTQEAQKPVEEIGSRAQNSSQSSNQSSTQANGTTGSSQSSSGATTWTPKHLTFAAGSEYQNLSSQTQTLVQNIDQSIVDYKSELDKRLVESTSPTTGSGELYAETLEALDAFNKTTYIYNDTTDPVPGRGAYAVGSTSSIPIERLRNSQGQVDEIVWKHSSPTVNFYKEVKDIYANGASSVYDRAIRYRYDAIPSGQAGLLFLTAHESSHTISTHMLDKTAPQAISNRAFESKADQWARGF